MNRSLLDTSDEFVIQRWGGGLKLIRPDKVNNKNPLVNISSLHTVKSILELPINVYFLNTESIIQNMNELTMVSCKYTTKKGLNSCDSAISKSANYIINNDQEVLKTKKMKIFDEHFIRKSDDIDVNAISIKLPWYNNENKIIGLVGFSIVTNQSNSHSLANSIALINKTILSNNFDLSEILSGLEISGICFTKRELECLYYLLHGITTAKSIAKMLGSEWRTIETHLEHIKSKMNISSKSELVEKFFDYSTFIRR